MFSWLRFSGRVALAMGCVAVRLAAQQPEFDAMKRLVRTRFPGVPQLSTAELQTWLDDRARPQPRLLDVRTEAEYRMSHLPHAVRVDPSARPSEVLAAVPPGSPLVVYCSVGYRSSALAEKLMKAGAKNVRNLEGSIFQWANEHRPLEAEGQAAAKVHPYNATFGKMLAPERRGEATPAK